MSQFKRQRINPLPGGRNFSGTASTSLLGPPPGLLTPPVATELSQNARHLQGGEKQRVFTGIVTSLHDYFGVVDEEVFFQLSVVKGRLPQLGEKVLVKAAYNPGQAVPWNAVKVQTLSNQPLLKSPAPPLLHVAALGQKQGILGAQPQLIFQPHRIPPLFPQKREYEWHCCWVWLYGVLWISGLVTFRLFSAEWWVLLCTGRKVGDLDNFLGFFSHRPFPFCSSESLPNIPHTSPEPPQQISCPGPSWTFGSGPKVRG